MCQHRKILKTEPGTDSLYCLHTFEKNAFLNHPCAIPSV